MVVSLRPEQAQCLRAQTSGRGIGSSNSEDLAGLRETGVNTASLPAGTLTAPHWPLPGRPWRADARGCSARWLCPCPGDLGSGGRVVMARGGHHRAAGKRARRAGRAHAH